MPSPAQEPLRQQYLSAMGVTSWLPLHDLPGAAPSPRWEWQRSRSDNGDSRPVRQAGEAATATVSVAPAPQARSALKALLAGAVDPGPAPTQTPVVSATASDTVAQGASPVPLQHVNEVAVVPAARTLREAGVTPRFSLALLQVQDLLVVNALPPNRPGGLNATHQRLLAEIVLVLGRQMGAEPIEIFNWPLVNNPTLDQGPALARQGVLARLRKLLPQAPSMIMAMGDAAIEFVPENWADTPMVRLETPSLDQLLRIPGAKRELWLQLQDYRPRA